MIEAALRTALIEAIPELENEIYPTNAPEDATKPYLVYMRISTNKLKTLDGVAKEYLSFMFNIMATRYSDMKSLTEQVEGFLMSLPGMEIDGYYIEDVNVNNISEQYEHELKVNRGIIDFTIYYEEVE